MTVTGIEPGASRVTLGDGRVLGYDRLLLATGAEPRRLHIPGADLDRVCYLRTLADCDLLRAQLGAGGRVVVVGAGWIGSEFAASARQRGLEVTVIDPQPLPNERIFGREVAAFYRDVHAQHGIEFLLGDGVEAFEGNGAVSRVRTASGRRVECDFAVVGIGVVPRTGLASGAGLEVSNGIVADAQLPDRRAGHLRGRRRRERVAPVLPAGGSGSSTGRTRSTRDPPPPGPCSASGSATTTSRTSTPTSTTSAWSTPGYAPQWDEVGLRGDRVGGEFIAFWLRGGRVAAGMNVNVWDVNEHVQALIRCGPGRSRRLRWPIPASRLASLVSELAAGS